MRKPYPRPVLGLIVHKVIERAMKGELNNIENAHLEHSIRELWDKVAQIKETELKNSWDSASVPRRENWRDYSVLKVTTVKSLHSKIMKFRQSTSYGNKPPRVEKPLKDPLIGLDGRPDRVEFRAEGLYIVDVKSSNQDLTIKESWKQQLLLYAHLVEVTENETPIAIVIESAGGERITENISSKQIRETVDNALLKVKNFNDNLETPMALANPTKENCQYCSYRPQCQPFWETVQYDWSNSNVRGKLLRSKNLNGRTMITLRPIAPDWPVREVHVSPMEGELPQGIETVSIVDAGWTQNANTLAIEWNTLVAFDYSED
jgi:CRISPR/Cas system-associated exonuclease Cas4 (RecB family)